MPRILHMAIFIGIFALILALTHFYIYTRLCYYLQLSDTRRRVVAIALVVLPVLTLFALPLSRSLPRAVTSTFDWVVFIWMGIFMFLFLSLMAVDIIWLITSVVSPSYDPQRRGLMLKTFGGTALGATAVLGAYSLWNGLRPVTVKPVEITLKRLPRALDGLRIVQITDLHIGPLIDGDWLRHVVSQVNALNPDIIAVTGDLVDGSVENLAPHVAPLADLRAAHGVYFITGNHEYYSGVEEWCAHIKTLGLRVLRNERVSITANGVSLDLAGVEDWGSKAMYEGTGNGGPDLTKALAGRDTDKPVILLAHQPAAIHEAADHGVDLQLSGHTHGGQIWPFTYLVYLQQPFTQGLHRYRDTATQIYVSPGTGFWGPPMRLGTTAEITHITLRSG